MKTERKFNWCVRYYNVNSGVIDYRIYNGWTTREIEEHVSEFVFSNGDYIVNVFKSFKKFCL